MQVQGSQNSPTSGVVNAKWRAGTNTRVSINPSTRAYIKNRVMSIGIQDGKKVVSKINMVKPVI